MAVHHYWETNEFRVKDPQLFHEKVAHLFFEGASQLRGSLAETDVVSYSGWQTSESPNLDDEAEWVREAAWDLIEAGILDGEDSDWEDEFSYAWDLFRNFLVDDSVFSMRQVTLGNGPMVVSLSFGTNKNRFLQGWSLDYAEDKIIAEGLADPYEGEWDEGEEDE